MTDKVFVIVEGTDWAGLYVDGKLVAENHSISQDDLVQQLAKNGVNIRVEELHPKADEQMSEFGRTLPKDFSGVLIKHTRH